MQQRELYRALHRLMEVKLQCADEQARAARDEQDGEHNFMAVDGGGF